MGYKKSVCQLVQVSVVTSIIVLCLFPTTICLAENEVPRTVSVAGTSILLPAPDGYFRYDGKSRKIDEIQQSFLPASNRLLASFSTEEDLKRTLQGGVPRLNRSFNAQTVRSLEAVDIASSQFIAFKNSVRTQADRARQQLGNRISAVENNASTTLSEQLDGQIDFKLGDMVLLGVFDEALNSISFSMLIKSRISIAERGEIEGVSVASISAVLVRQRLVFLYCTSSYKDNRDVVWTRTSVTKWRDDVLAANSQAALVSPNSNPNANPISQRFPAVRALVEGGPLGLAATFALSLLVTWTVGLAPPLLIRYVFLARPLSRKAASWTAGGFSVFFWCSFFVLHHALGEKPGTGIVWLVVFLSRDGL